MYSAGLGLRIIADLRLYRLTLVGDVKERGLNPWIACVPNPVPETRTVAEGYRAQRESYHETACGCCYKSYTIFIVDFLRTVRRRLHWIRRCRLLRQREFLIGLR